MLSLLNNGKKYTPFFESYKCLIGNSVGFFSGRKTGEDYFHGTSFVDLRQCLNARKKMNDILILPVSYDEQKFVLTHKERLRENGYLYYINNQHLLDLCSDKINFVKYIESIGMVRFLPKNVSFDDAMDMVDDEHMVIAKPATGTFGKGIVLCRSKAELRQCIFNDKVSYLFQEYIGGSKEYAFHFVADNGELCFFTAFEHCHTTFEYVQGINDSNYQTLECSIPIETIREFAELLSALKYCGFGCIDFKYNNIGQAKVFEINPRLGASLGIRPKLLSHGVDAYAKCCFRNRK